MRCPMLFTVFFGIISFAFAVALAIVGVTSKSISLDRRIMVLFGAVVLSVPGFWAMYMLFIFSVLIFNSPPF
ncbi:exported hypothetical protein [Mesorhizobium sp. STM 4661]|nr:exported hypothetical protein [Mesorhizobium sp. STM 4661]